MSIEEPQEHGFEGDAERAAPPHGSGLFSQDKNGAGTALAGRPATGTALEQYDFGEDAGAGKRNLTQADRLTPFLNVLQKGSPICDNAMPDQYREDARPGMFYNTATGELYDGAKGLEFVPATEEHLYTEWGLDRGGFKGTRAWGAPAIDRLIREQGKFKTLKTVDDDGSPSDLVEQYNLYLLFGEAPLTADNAQPAVMAFTSTKIKVIKAMNTRDDLIVYRNKDGGRAYHPLYAHYWRMTTVPMQNDSGTWFNPKLELIALNPPDALVRRRSIPLYDMARAFCAQVEAGQQRADYAAAEGAKGEDEIPF